MATKKRWGDLTLRMRRLIIAGGTFETVLKVIALIDLKRRPAAEIRGSKRTWALAIGFVSSAGALPIAYLLYGRQKRSPR